MNRGKRRLGVSRARRNERRFADAVRAHQAGRLDEAGDAYRRIVDADPEHAGALHYLGLIEHQRGALREAVLLLERASRAAGADASLFNNLGNMLRESARLDEAIEAYRECVRRDPGHANARFNLATTLLDSGRGEEAVQAFHWFLDRGSDDPALWNAYAHALLLGGQDGPASEAFRRASELNPHEPGLRVNLVEALGRTHAIEDALMQARRAHADFPDDLKVRRALGLACLNMTRFAEAYSVLQPVLEATPPDVQVRAALCRCLVEQGEPQRAVSLADEGLAMDPEDAGLLLAKGSALIRAVRPQQAIECLEAARALQPAWVEPVNNLGILHADLGHMEEAESLFRKVLSMDPHTPEAWFHLSRSPSGEAVSDSDVALLGELAQEQGVAPERRVALHFALAQMHDRRRDYARAFRYYTSANELKRRLGRFDSEHFTRWVQGFHDVFDEHFLSRLGDTGNPSARPVFVLGMPRSGTTLVEQILASHPQICGGDELSFVPDIVASLTPAGDEGAYPGVARGLDRAQVGEFARTYLQRLAGVDDTAQRVTDKMPSNYFHIPLISVMFPNAAIIHCTRNAMDVCFSNYIQLFASAHFYSYSLRDIAVYYREYARLMQKWERLLPGRIFNVSYEALLADQEGVSRGLIAELGLPWDAACLRFHETRRVVTTASQWQVRQPLYTSARQRWRKYAPFLQELMDGIGYTEEVA